MKTSLDCIPCLVRQALKVARMAHADEQAQERILREVFFLLKVKCPLVGRHLGHPVGSLVVHRHKPDD